MTEKELVVGGDSIFCTDILDKTRCHGSHIPGWMRDVELYWLEMTAQMMDTIVEVGTWKGRSAYCMAKSCKGMVWTIDPFTEGEISFLTVDAGEDVEAEFLEYCKEPLKENLRHIKKTSLEAAEDFCTVDMVFIDGSHTYEDVKKDIEAWLPKAKIMICGHDYDMEEVRRAVDEKFGNYVKRGYGAIWYVETISGIGDVG